MAEYTDGARVCSTVKGWYYRIPGTVRNVAPVQYGNLGTRYVVELDDGRTIEMPADELDTPTDADVAACKERMEQNAAHEREVKERNERKRQARRDAEEARAKRRQDEQDQKQAEADAECQARQDELRKQHARDYGLASLRR